MAGILTEKGINHWYDEQKWIDHDWVLWRMVFRNLLEGFSGKS
jgi:enterochelin esterase-like enzyme